MITFTKQELREIVEGYRYELNKLRNMGRMYVGKEDRPEFHKPMMLIYNQIKRFERDMTVWEAEFNRVKEGSFNG